MEGKPQKQRVLEALLEKKGEWVSGQYFLRVMYLSQYHARIFELQKDGYSIEPSDFEDFAGFKSYRLVDKDQMTLFP